MPRGLVLLRSSGRTREQPSPLLSSGAGWTAALFTEDDVTEDLDGTVLPIAESTPLPTGVRVASTLCWLVGILSILMALAVGIPAMSNADGGVVPMVVNLIAAVTVCVAGYLVRQRRKVGALLVVAAWALPTAVSLIDGGGAKPGNFLLFAAMIGL